MHYLYKITNRINKKNYIGHTINIRRRWQAHKSYSKQEKPPQAIHLAMAKYGIDNFQLEVIATCRTQDDADEIEVQLIKQYDSRNKEKGYNIVKGGDTLGSGSDHPSFGKKHSEERKRNISRSLTGRPVSEETRRLISQSQKNQPRWSAEQKQQMSIDRGGSVLSKKHKEKISQSLKGKYVGEKHSQSKLTWDIVRKIRKEYALGGISMAKLAEKYGVSSALISRVVNNQIWILQNYGANDEPE